MRSLIIPLFVSAMAFASPTPLTDNILRMRSELAKSDACTLPAPGSTCAGATLKDVIIEFPKNFSTANANLLKGATTASGGKVTYDWSGGATNFGFAAHVPDQVLDLMKEYGQTLGVSVTDDACVSIPDCGAGPC